jgi:hypothetical protein
LKTPSELLDAFRRRLAERNQPRERKDEAAATRLLARGMGRLLARHVDVAARADRPGGSEMRFRIEIRRADGTGLGSLTVEADGAVFPGVLFDAIECELVDVHNGPAIDVGMSATVTRLS